MRYAGTALTVWESTANISALLSEAARCCVGGEIRLHLIGAREGVCLHPAGVAVWADRVVSVGAVG